MISVQNISYKIKDLTILENISFELKTAQIVALIGPNGAGKSTLFSLMARVMPMQAGKVCFGGLDNQSTDSNTLAKQLAMLTQENHLQGRLRVRELLLFGRYPYHLGQATQSDFDKVDEVMHAFELDSLAERFLSDLSGGQRQRVLIAMIICQDTPYILLDEPLNNLDMYHTKQLMQYIRTLADNGKTVVAVLHDINQASQFADTVVMLKQGQITHIGTPSQVITAPNIKALYGVDSQILWHNGKPIVV